MGASQSIQYAEYNEDEGSAEMKQVVNVNELPVINVLDSEELESDGSDTRRFINLNDSNENIKKYFNQQLKKLETTLKLSLLFDNYENKNNVIINDLNKKYKSQNKEIKQLYENKDKIKNIIQIYREKIDNNLSIKKRLKIINIILFIIIVLMSIVIIKFKYGDLIADKFKTLI